MVNDDDDDQEATSRGEKRWMNQMNEAHRRKLRTQEYVNKNDDDSQ